MIGLMPRRIVHTGGARVTVRGLRLPVRLAVGLLLLEGDRMLLRVLLFSLSMRS
jgi:hypothetical protein